MVEMCTFNDPMAITLKIGKTELQFICSVRPLIALYIYLRFRETTGYQSYGADTNNGSADERTDKRTPKISKDYDVK